MADKFDFEIKFDDRKLMQSVSTKFGIGSPVQKFADEMIKNGMKPYVPFLTGTLERSADINTVIGSGEIIYRTPYAKKQYYKGREPGTGETGQLRGLKWAERAANDLLPEWKKQLQRFVNKK